MNNDYCFSVLALRPKYQVLTKKLAEDMEKYFPGIQIVVGTDNPDTFKECKNVSAFKLDKKGILLPYHDKRFVIEKALMQFKVVIQIDADTNVVNSLPSHVSEAINSASTGLAACHTENLIEHVRKYNPERLYHLGKLANKLGVDLNKVTYIGEALFAISGEHEKTTEFIRQWDLSARYLELHRIHAGQGNAMGIAAAKVGLEIIKPSWLQDIKQVTRHFDAASTLKTETTLWNQLTRRIDYHYRFTKARITALKDFDFYYR